MRGEREFAEAGCHGHGYCSPCPVTLGAMWRLGPWPLPGPRVRTKMINSRTTASAMIPNTLT
jgi:hypothetical protein